MVGTENGAGEMVFNTDFGHYLLASAADISAPAAALVTRLVGGDEEMNSHDNLDIQPHTRNVYVT